MVVEACFRCTSFLTYMFEDQRNHPEANGWGECVFLLFFKGVIYFLKRNTKFFVKISDGTRTVLNQSLYRLELVEDLRKPTNDDRALI